MPLNCVIEATNGKFRSNKKIENELNILFESTIKLDAN